MVETNFVKLCTGASATLKIGKNVYWYSQEASFFDTSEFFTIPVPGPISWAVLNKIEAAAA